MAADPSKKTPGSRWKQVQRHVEEEVEKKKKEKWKDLTATEKWQLLSKSAKSGVGDFFGVSAKSETESNKKKWEHRTRNLMASSALFGRHLARPTPAPQGEVEGDQSARGLLTDHVDASGISKRMQRGHLPDTHMKRRNVWTMTADGMRNFLSDKPRHKPTSHARSFAPCCMETRVARPQHTDDFFQYASYSSPTVRPSAFKMAASVGGEGRDYDEVDRAPARLPGLGEKTAKLLSNGLVIKRRGTVKPTGKAGEELPEDEDIVDGRAMTGLKRMMSNVFEDLTDNTDRSSLGVGFVAKCLDWDYSTHHSDPEVRKQLDEFAQNQHRPFFTYWVTFVQIVCFIFAVAVYGIAPIGFSETRIEAEILKPSLSIEIVHYTEADNLWIGPRQADLIHLGARYSPCMRRDANVEAAIADDRYKESLTACCIRNDGSGCVQTQKGLCSMTLSTWKKYGALNDSTGSVCGQDPKYCKNPLDIEPFKWSKDISKWPICKESAEVSKGEDVKHMKCEILGRPCCVGIQGQCIITTREFCEFRRGYFHEEANLCSQVSCMNEICGMIPFYNPEKPNQFYRLWTSLFLHAGVFQLVITVLFHWFVMREMEIFAGWLRIGIIYIMSGIAGSLGSAIFIPYHVEAGPSGSQFGILACVFVQAIQMWPQLPSPCWVIGKLTIILVCLFIVGLLPMIDNWAHLFGFLFGFLLAFALLPYVKFDQMDARRKLIGIVICLITTVGMFLILVLLFYVIPIYKCPNCEYFNCIPITPTFCKSMEVKITRNEEY